MSTFFKKVNYVFVPYLLVSVITISIYLAFIWLFEIKLNILALDNDLLRFVIPMAIPWLPVLLFLRRRLRVLRYKNENNQFLTQALMVFSMSIPMIAGSYYLDLLCYDLIPIDNIQDIAQHNNDHFFDIKNSTIKLDNTSVELNSRS